MDRMHLPSPQKSRHASKFQYTPLGCKEHHLEDSQARQARDTSSEVESRRSPHQHGVELTANSPHLPHPHTPEHAFRRAVPNTRSSSRSSRHPQLLERRPGPRPPVLFRSRTCPAYTNLRLLIQSEQDAILEWAPWPQRRQAGDPPARQRNPPRSSVACFGTRPAPRAPCTAQIRRRIA